MLREYVQSLRHIFSMNAFLVCDLVTGGVALLITISRLLRGELGKGKVGSLLSAAPISPDEGGVDAGGAGELEGGVGGGRLSGSYSWPMDKTRWLQGHIGFLLVAGRYVFLALELRGHFNFWAGFQSAAP